MGELLTDIAERAQRHVIPTHRVASTKLSAFQLIQLFPFRPMIVNGTPTCSLRIGGFPWHRRSEAF